jgi:hypothetical protein
VKPGRSKGAMVCIEILSSWLYMSLVACNAPHRLVSKVGRNKNDDKDSDFTISSRKKRETARDPHLLAIPVSTFSTREYNKIHSGTKNAT